MVRWPWVVGACCASSAALAQVPAIRVVKEQAMVAACQRLGEVRGSSLLGGIFASAAYDRALDEMKEKVATLGGNHLLLFDLTTGQAGANGYGEAYRCDPVAEPAPRRRR